MATPRISLVAFEDRDPRKAFVAVPTEKGRYVFTDRCVVEVDCPACGSAIGEPCRNQHHPNSLRYWSGTHADRRNKGARIVRDMTYEQRMARSADRPVFPAAPKRDFIFLESRDAS